MMLRSYELQSAEEAEEEAVLEPAINERLGDVRCPTLVIVGDEDIADMQGIAAHVAASIGDARLATVAGASHLPSLSAPRRSPRSSSGSWPSCYFPEEPMKPNRSIPRPPSSGARLSGRPGGGCLARDGFGFAERCESARAIARSSASARAAR